MRKFVLLILFCMIFSSAAQGENELALTVQGIPVTKTEAYIYILNAEEKYAEIVDYYDTYLGIDYWALEYASGMTISEMVKSDVFKEMLMMNVFCYMAESRHLHLTPTEKAACVEDAKRTYALLPVSAAALISETELAGVFEKQRLADRTYSMLLSEMDIDEESVRSAVDADKYKTYEVEYLFRSLTDYGDNGSAHALSPEKEKAVRNAFESAKAYSSLQDAEEDYKSLGLMYAAITFSSDDESIDPALLSEVTRLTPGETGGVLKTDFGLFLIRLIDNSSTQAYTAAVESALYAAREAAFSETYNRMFMNAEYEINVSFWDSIMPGMMKNPD